MFASVLALVGLVAAACAAAGASPSQVTEPPESAPPETAPPGAGATDDLSADGAGAADIEFSDMVKLGLLLMERKPAPGDLPTAPVVPDPTPWRDAYRTGPNEGSPIVIPPPALGPGDGRVYAVGDSVLLGCANYLGEALAGWNVTLDAEVGRRFPEGIDSLLRHQNLLGQVLVVVLGHNYGGRGASYGYIDEIMAVAGRKAQRVVFVTVTEWSPAQAEVNRAIYDAAGRYPNVVVAPWAETVKANPQFLWDHVHPNSAGQVALANLIGVMVGPGNGQDPKLQRIPPPGPPVSVTTTTSRPTTSSSSSTTSTTATTKPPGTTAPTSSTTSTTSAPP